MYGNFYVVTE